MIAYRGYHYARRRGGACSEVWHIFKNGAYLSYGDTPAQAKALIDTYISWGDRSEDFTLSKTIQGAYSITAEGTETLNFCGRTGIVKFSLTGAAVAKLRDMLARTPLPRRGFHVYEVKVTENQSPSAPYEDSLTIETWNEAAARDRAIKIAMAEWGFEDAESIVIKDIRQVR